MTQPNSAFCDYLPFEGGMGLYLNKLQFFSPKDDMYQSLIETAWHAVSGEKEFKNWSRYFCYFSLSPLGKKCCPLFEEI